MKLKRILLVSQKDFIGGQAACEAQKCFVRGGQAA